MTCDGLTPKNSRTPASSRSDVLHGVVDGDVRVLHELEEVLVGRADLGAEAGLLRDDRDRADEVVGLEARLLEDREAEEAAEALGVLDLRDEVVGHRLALRLVRGVHLLAERLLVPVEADGDGGGLAVRDVLPPHVQEAVDRVRGLAARAREAADRVERAVEVVRRVDQRERGPFGGRHRGESIRGACQNRGPREAIATPANGRDAVLAAVVFAALSLLGQHTWGTVDAIQRFAVTRSLVERGSAVTPEFGPGEVRAAAERPHDPDVPAREGARAPSRDPTRGRSVTGRRPSSSRRFS